MNLKTNALHGLKTLGHRGIALLAVTALVGAFVASSLVGSAGPTPAPTTVSVPGIPNLDWRLVWEGGLVTASIVDIESWSWGVANTPAVGTGSGTVGLTSGRPQVAELVVQRAFDINSTMIARHCILGTHVSKLTLEGWGTNHETDRNQIYVTITMTDVLVTSYQSSATDDSVPFETVSFSYAKIEYKYATKGPTPMSWDITQNRQYGA